MIIEQTIEIPASHRIFIDLPQELPVGKAKVEFNITPETAVNRTPISRYFGILSPATYGDGVAYQRKLRDEWDD
jgi:hypothetical protein